MIKEDLKTLDSKLLGKKYFENINRSWQLDVFYKRMYDIYYICACADINLARAANKGLELHDWELYDESIEYKIRFYERGNYLKSAMLSYNSIEDYINNILCFTLGLKLKNKKNYIDYSKINSCKEYLEKSRKITFKRMEQALEKDNFSEIHNLAYEYRNNTKYIRDYSNKIKHGIDERFKEFEKPNHITFKIQGKNEKEYSDEWTTVNSESIEDVIEKCYELQPKIIAYIEKIFNIIAESYGCEMI